MQKTKRFLNLKIIIILIIIITAFGIYFFPKLKGPAKNKSENKITGQSIAVLPFEDESKDSSMEYFSVGLTEGILNSLSRLKDLKVTARTSSFKFRNNDADVTGIGNKLGVRTLLEGSYQLEGDRIKITAQLINVKNGAHFWSEQYDENLDNIFSLQNKIVNAVVENLDIATNDNPLQNIIKKQTTSIEAYKLYLKGRSSLNKRTPGGTKKGN